jgi:hypothetical protein
MDEVECEEDGCRGEQQELKHTTSQPNGPVRYVSANLRGTATRILYLPIRIGENLHEKALERL